MAEQRLIDADALIDGMKKRCNSLIKEYGSLDHYADGFAEAINYVENAPTVDAVLMDDMKEFAKDVVYQYGYYGQYNGRLHIGNGGLSTLEEAFDILGWDNPHPAPEFECEIDGCHERVT